ncbi:MAG: sulfatase [Planctomycetota bacterium]
MSELTAAGRPGRGADPRPNILLLHWHDLGRNLGCYGVPGVVSPRLDALAGEGMRFDRAFCASPLCTPARGSIFTGRYPHSNGLIGLVPQGWAYHEGERTLPMLLREHGYHTALIGQQHESHRPETLGFDELRLVEGWQTYDRVEPLAVDFLRGTGRGDRPFFASVGLFEVHRLGRDHYPANRYPPIDEAAVEVPAFLEDCAETRGDLVSFYGAIRAADAAVGRVLDALDGAGLRDNTWVIFTTDHGMAFPGAKSTLYDPGIGVSLLMRWPGRLPAGLTSDAMLSHVDLVPTVLDALALDIPDNVQGLSVWPALASPDVDAPRTHVFAERTYHGTDYDPMRAVRTTEYKYIRNYTPGLPPPMPDDVRSSDSAVRLPRRLRTPRPAEELYDLESDPEEHRNLAAQGEFEPVRAELAGRLEDWMRTTRDPLLRGPIPSPVARAVASQPVMKTTK